MLCFWTYQQSEEDQGHLLHFHVESDISIQGAKLDVSDSFVYFGSILSRNGSLNSEINLRNAKSQQSL